MAADNWYEIKNCNALDTPAIAIYLDRVKQNIHTLINSIDDVARLRPHIKTHKSPEVSSLMLEAGIKKFKCATISEGEMLALIEAPDVLLAYQPVGPKATRLFSLIKKYPATRFSCLIDNEISANELAEVFAQSGESIPVYIDLNVGMNRTGIIPDQAYALYEHCRKLNGFKIASL